MFQKMTGEDFSPLRILPHQCLIRISDLFIYLLVNLPFAGYRIEEHQVFFKRQRLGGYFTLGR